MQGSTIAKYVAGLVLTGAALAIGLVSRDIVKDKGIEVAKARYEMKENELVKEWITLSNSLQANFAERSSALQIEFENKFTSASKASIEYQTSLMNKSVALSNSLYAENKSFQERAKAAEEAQKNKETEFQQRKADLERKFYGSLESLAETNNISLTPLERQLYLFMQFHDTIDLTSLNSANIYFDDNYKGVRVKAYLINRSDTNLVAIIREKPDNELISAHLFRGGEPLKKLTFKDDEVFYVDHNMGRVYKIKKDKMMYKSFKSEVYDSNKISAGIFWEEFQALWHRGPNQSGITNNTEKAELIGPGIHVPRK